MCNTAGLYHKLIPSCIKKWIDPDTFRIQQFIASEIQKKRPHSPILDAGAGESLNRKLIKGQFYVAMDAAWGDPSWDYTNLDVIADLVEAPFKSDTFELVICTQVLEHVKEPLMVLAELFRVTKPGGTLCVSAPQGWGVHQAPFDYFRYTHFGLQHLIAKAGFVDIQATPTCGYFGYLANRLTVLPKTMFWQIKHKWLRLALSPIEILAYIIFVLFLPILLNSVDFLDRERNYTLNYLVRAIKPIPSYEL